ncbi:hypothetical protein KP509_39G031200 [Ceratopteris richardii]|uniref:Uncharacterized protein n=1 Tax=Ceratopteris richardii TaxID=49495 RepID=A0A8T2PZF9_CERRI|nr:hypothetical protein KP509_39G031200 [Ceratopteris richardii]
MKEPQYSIFFSSPGHTQQIGVAFLHRSTTSSLYSTTSGRHPPRIHPVCISLYQRERERTRAKLRSMNRRRTRPSELSLGWSSPSDAIDDARLRMFSERKRQRESKVNSPTDPSTYTIDDARLRMFSERKRQRESKVNSPTDPSTYTCLTKHSRMMQRSSPINLICQAGLELRTSSYSFKASATKLRGLGQQLIRFYKLSFRRHQKSNQTRTHHHRCIM